jgi:oligopeptide/dipeptide ABC transporter ATP-binding protein
MRNATTAIIPAIAPPTKRAQVGRRRVACYIRAVLLVASALTVEYGGVRVVDDVSLAIDAGGALALVGESGAGKTTTALALAALLPAAARVVGGTAILDGVDLLGGGEAARAHLRGARIAFVFQDAAAALHPLFTVGDQVGEPLRIHRGVDARSARSQAVDLLRLVGISDAAGVAASHPHQLSGGTQKRALVATALALDPPILVADEPTAGLDAPVAAALLDLLDARRRERGMALLMVTHDLAVAARAGEIAVMYAGRIVERAPAAALLSRPAHPYTAGLLRALPRLDGDPRPLDEIAAAAPSPTPAAGCRFRARCPSAQARCAEEEPALLPTDGARTIRCHFPLDGAAA